MKEFKLENETKITTGFVTPDNYFEDFSAKFMQNLPSNEVAVVKVIPLYKRRSTIISLIAAIFAIALMLPIFNQSPVATTSTEIDQASLENYLSYQTNVSQYDLINSLETEDLEDLSAPVTTTTLEQETIEDLLVDNGNLEHYIIE
ncbi:hypothetical protein [Flavobacterium sp. 14A]|uniref:hypothetical protein n=1 Tax=Flavobacterium sp. 14A TaxID=2735896 RepID=UPI00156DEF3A|nr:hypothetical protein [Flavobacterium sp. 14A]NRT12571.1 hypothetical protein [Flavobacterium sp. 14A]